MTLRTEKKDRRWPSFSSSSDLYPTITPVLSLTSSFATVGRNTGRLYRKRKEWLLKVELLSSLKIRVSGFELGPDSREKSSWKIGEK